MRETVDFAREMDLDTIQVSLATPYPGTELYAQAQAHGWLKADSLIDEDGFQGSVLQCGELTTEEIYKGLEDFYKQFYMRPRPILRMLSGMVRDRDECARRLREGWEFFRFFGSRGKAVS
jgi:radical SAM superfamily enzyme YgiQ (UPF0313 family)